MIGSIRVGWAFSIASLNAIEPAILNAISDESTEWCWPSKTVTLTSRTGKPATVPVRMASCTPFSTAGMKPPGITPPLIALTNSKPLALLGRLDLDVAIGELAASARLLLVAGVGLGADP